MKRVVLALACVLCCLSAHAQFGNRNLSFDFSFTAEGDMTVTGNGSAVIQDDCYHVDTNGLDIWCDGQTRWTIDKESKEVYIEDAGNVASFIDYMDTRKLEGTSGRVELGLTDGTEVHLDVKNLNMTDPQNLCFTFDTGTLSKDYVITDLR